MNMYCGSFLTKNNGSGSLEKVETEIEDRIISKTMNEVT
jgi:hypothetical protein